MIWHKLYARIYLPFLALFLVVSLISLLLNRHYISKLMDKRISAQTERISKILSNSEFVLNPIYLKRLQDVIDGEIIIFAENAEVVVSTLPDKVLPRFKTKIEAGRIFSILKENQQKPSQIIIKQGLTTYLATARIVSYPVQPAKKMLLCFISPLTDVISIKTTITRLMLLVSSAGIFLLIIFGYFISRTITKPVTNLAAFTREIANGHFDQKVALPAIDELKLLAFSINIMTEKLAAYEKQVAASSRLAAAGKITAAMAHEFKNPLSSIKMLSQLLRDSSELGRSEIELVNALLEEITRLERIVNDLTGLIRPAEFKFKSCNLNSIIQKTMQLIEPKLAHRKIVLSARLAKQLPAIKCDSDKIKQVIWNILLNAMESMSGSGVIIIKTIWHKAENQVIMVVKDEGSGVAENLRESVFNQFYSNKPEGLGLGLSISLEIMETHGGCIKLTNRTYKGTNAVISFPVDLKV